MESGRKHENILQPADCAVSWNSAVQASESLDRGHGRTKSVINRIRTAGTWITLITILLDLGTDLN